jgi:hypothetical protein
MSTEERTVSNRLIPTEHRHDDPSRQLDGALLEHGGQATR